MFAQISGKRRVALLGLSLALAPWPGAAEVTRVDVQRREDVLGGKTFGDVGAYEKVVGKVHFAVDPKNPRNKVIADLDLAPKNARGQVEFSSDFYIIKPKDSARGNGVALFDMVNRGGKALLRVFNRATASPDPTSEAEFGDGYLLHQGYTLVATGWQFDVGFGKGLVGFDPPIATDGGKPITGWVRMWFLSNQPVPAFEYAGTSYNTRAYPPLDLASQQYRLTEREGTYAPARIIPREEWQFARVDNGTLVPDPNWIHLKSGMKPGMTYEVAYETKNPPVAGLGLAAIRDMASALKYDPKAVAAGRYAYIFGSSQTGRGIRHLIYEGFTIDEKERKAFDGALVQTGATGYGSFNQRFAQPNELGSFTQTKFPFLYKTTTDPITGRQDGMGARIPVGLEPKLLLVDSGSEYWDRGRVAALRHTSPDGREDVEDAPNVRVYLLAGTRHGSGSFPPNDNGGAFKENPNEYRWAQRGLLAALDAWVRQGTAPPPSRHPKLSDGTLVARDKLEFPPIPGVKWPARVPGGYRSDVPGPDAALAFMVSKVDADGNDVGGIRLPEQAVPLATMTGWQFRSERIGAPDTLLAMAGAYIPFPATRAERARTKDPRLSIEERYGTRAGYLEKIRESAAALARERYILTEDVAAIEQAAKRHWDALMTPAGGADAETR
jgi:alpha/beta hydrolase family protein